MKKSKGVKKPAIIGNLDLPLTKEQRKSLFKYWYRFYGCHQDHGNDHWARTFYDNDYNRALRVNQVKLWASVMGYEEEMYRKTAEAIYIKYWDRFINKYLLPKVKRNGGVFPSEKKSTTLYIMLSRGFVYEGEFKWDPSKYYVKCTLAPLWYPVPYDHHQDALGMAKKIGVNGYTSCPIAGKTTSF